MVIMRWRCRVEDLAGNRGPTATSVFRRTSLSNTPDPIDQWMQIGLDAIRSDASDAPMATRSLAMLSMTMFQNHVDTRWFAQPHGAIAVADVVFCGGRHRYGCVSRLGVSLPEAQTNSLVIERDVGAGGDPGWPGQTRRNRLRSLRCRGYDPPASRGRLGRIRSLRRQASRRVLGAYRAHVCRRSSTSMVRSGSVECVEYRSLETDGLPSCPAVRIHNISRKSSRLASSHEQHSHS